MQTILPANVTLDLLPAAVDGVAFARLYGEPLFKLPTDLYIPPEALEVFLEAFEGPLDLLLYLIRRQDFNILDIPLARVTEQYLSYVDEIRSRNLELAADYLLMAAMLIEIKSRMLLPLQPSETGQEAEDPRAELVRRLLEYERMKLAAQELDALPQVGRDFWPAAASVDKTVVVQWPSFMVSELQTAWQDILRRAKLSQNHSIAREALSVRDYMSRVMRRLQGQRFMDFESLFEAPSSVAVVIVTFVAILELARKSLIEITQGDAYAPIYVRLSPAQAHV